MSTPVIGEPAPDFSAAATGGRTLNLSDCRGQFVVLYFYPKDSTPGCTLEGQQFRDLYDAFTARAAVILGVSRDSVRSHENFCSKQALPFPLLSDADESLCKAYDVLKLKKMYGRESIGVERSTFLIDRDGVLQREWRKVKVEGHAQAVLAALESLTA